MPANLTVIAFNFIFIACIQACHSSVYMHTGPAARGRKWVDSDDSDDGKPPVVPTTATLTRLDEVLPTAFANDVTALNASERSEARMRMASSLLAAASSDEEPRTNGRARLRTAHTEAEKGAKPASAFARGATRRGARTTHTHNESTHDERGTDRPGSSLLRVRDVTAGVEPAASPGYSQVRKERVKTVGSRVAKLLRHTSPGLDNSLNAATPCLNANTASSDSDNGPSRGGAHRKKSLAARRAEKHQVNKRDEDEDDKDGWARRPSAAEAADALRKKKKTQMAIKDCVKQNTVFAPLLKIQLWVAPMRCLEYSPDFETILTRSTHRFALLSFGCWRARTGM